MKLSKKDREIIMDKIKGKKIIIDDVAVLTWDAGKYEYNVGMKSKEIFTKDQYAEIYRIVNEATSKLKHEILHVVEEKFETVISILARNGFK